MAPEPHRGRRNDPRFVPLMTEKLAQIRGIPPEEAARATVENALRLYGIAGAAEEHADASSGTQADL